MSAYVNGYTIVLPDRSLPMTVKSTNTSLTGEKRTGGKRSKARRRRDKRMREISEMLSAKSEFFNNLGNYIALGSLSFSQDDTNLSSEWKQSEDPPTCIPTNNPLYLPLCTLSSSNSVQFQFRRHQLFEKTVTVRFYVLPSDVGRQFLDGDELKARKFLNNLIDYVDRSVESWEGRKSTIHQVDGYRLGEAPTDSLFYLFNTLPSPSPNSSSVPSLPARSAMELLLENDSNLPGLKATLYSYQKRSAAIMIQRETAPLNSLDPRLEPLKGPTEQMFYYDRETGVILRDAQTYEEAQGGILAETMGLGKTLICLATILATKGHWPKIPPQYSINLNPMRSKTGTLMQMTAATVGREQIPWKQFFQSKSRAGEDHGGCVAMLEETVGSYVIPSSNSERPRRYSWVPKMERIYLCTATLVIVPQNLFFQWTNQIALHLDRNALKVLYMDTTDTRMPELADILSYDLILMTKTRFEQEMKPFNTLGVSLGNYSYQRDDGVSYKHGDNQNRSHFRNIHFLRIIVDEGHDFTSSGRKSNATWALEKMHVERRWIVSGTPGAGLIGIELDLATNETRENSSNQRSEKDILDCRRFEILLKQELQDLEKLGHIVVDFLRVRPWANDKGEDLASWQKYIMPSKDGRRKTMSLGSILKSLVVRHRIEDVEVDIQLPPLQNRVVYLEPSWQDKLSINLFILILTVNAVTSERTDQDYMFHQSNRAQLDQLITNLRHSGFYWVSFPPKRIRKTLEICSSYIDKKLISDPHTYNTTEDYRLLNQVMETGYQALASTSWKAFAEFQELGIFVENFPEDSCNSLSLIQRETEDPFLIGATQLIGAQKYVDSRLYSSNPAYGLAELGKSTMKFLQHKRELNTERESSTETDTPKPKRNSGQPRSSSRSKDIEGFRLAEGYTMSRFRGFSSSGKNKHPREPSDAMDLDDPDTTQRPKSAMKAFASSGYTVEALPSESPIARANIIGTASAKLSYLIDQVLALQQEEKILIFYRGDHIAYFIAQAFDILGVRYLIYTGSITTDRRSIYITTFNSVETFRVMLMDVRQAAHGLHIASASRVFFVNPEWQPNVEAQAIKRAHRIGQTRPVYVETLVLKGTLEDQMLQRRKRMTTEEHQTAQKSLVDDPVMKDLIENLKPIPISQDETSNLHSQIALLREKQCIFGRVGRELFRPDDPDADPVLPRGTSSWKAKPGSRKRRFSYEHSPDSTKEMSYKRGKPSSQHEDADIIMTDDNHILATPSDTHNNPNDVAHHSPSPTTISTATTRRVAFSLD